MAESPVCHPLTVGGYDCEFVDSIPETLTCSVCLLPFRDPHLLDCCGIKLCRVCVERIDTAGQHCPHCREPFVHIPDKSIRRLVLAQNVRCSRNKDGCHWIGELRHLDDHEKKDCGIMEVPCSQCSELVSRYRLAIHQQEECLQQPIGIKLERLKKNMETKLTLVEDRYKKEIAILKQSNDIELSRQNSKLDEVKNLVQKLTQEKASMQKELKKLRVMVDQKAQQPAIEKGKAMTGP